MDWKRYNSLYAVLFIFIFYFFLSAIGIFYYFGNKLYKVIIKIKFNDKNEVFDYSNLNCCIRSYTN